MTHSRFALPVLCCWAWLGGCDPAVAPLDAPMLGDAPVAPGIDAPSVDGGVVVTDGGVPLADGGAMGSDGGMPLSDTGVDSRALHIVVIGSSTAAGKNLDIPMYGGRVGGLVDRWSDRYEAQLLATRPGSVVENLAMPGYATYSALPTGTSIPTTWLPGTGMPDPARNISHAIALGPDAIIVNMPLNRELVAGESLDALMANLHVMVDAAATAGIEVWIATSAAALDSTPSDVAALQAANTRTVAEFGTRVLDFYPTCALASGAADPALRLTDTSGHPNAACHQRLADVVFAASIPAAVLP